MPQPTDNLPQAVPSAPVQGPHRGDSDRASRRAVAHARGVYPPPLNPGRSRNMQANRRSNTKPEMLIRQLLHARGRRFRVDMRLDVGNLRVRPDIVFTKRKIAVFVDGCFWHVCPEHGRYPATNEWYWTPKLRRNMHRDNEVNASLADFGWTVIRAWEHEDPGDVAARICAEIDLAELR